jgi:anti-sigma regulatory factor (Ser/Thr protein kinase)
MAERIDLEVPATLNALSTVRMVLGGLGARLDFSLDDLEDIYLAADGLLRTALDADALDRLSVEMLVDDGGGLRFAAGPFKSAKLRADVTIHAEDCLDLCMLLRRTVDDVVFEDEGGAYRIVLVKQRKGGPA